MHEYIDKQDNGCWLWTGHVNAYGTPRYGGNGGENPRRLLSNHDGEYLYASCGNPLCVAPAHATVEDSRAHPKGEEHHKHILTADDVRMIRASGESHAALGRQYGCSMQNIWRIRNRITWRHI